MKPNLTGRFLRRRHQLPDRVDDGRDLAVVRAMADHIMVMKDGRLVEQGTPDEILENPREDYTKRLMAAAFA